MSKGFLIPRPTHLLLIAVIAVLAGWFITAKISQAVDDINKIASVKSMMIEEGTVVPPSPEGTHIISPHASSLISSPVKVTGKAPGPWFYEGAVIVKVLDRNGNVLGQGPAISNGDWMTKELVSFETAIPFIASDDQGFVMIQAGNSQGLDNPKSHFIPVKIINQGLGIECKPGEIAGTCMMTDKSGS